MTFEDNQSNKIVLTLDAGGTNFVFSAIQSNERIVENIIKPSHGDNLDKCLKSIVSGFDEVMNRLNRKPVAISFAFPGPADYPKGIIGDLSNLPAFKGGVALGPMLEEKFGLPVFINNDGDLFAYGEALAGFLPYINNLLKNSGNPKRYRNLLGVTIGTGFGAGIVRNEELFIGDNSSAGEIWLMRDKLSPNSNIEEHVSIRGLKKLYAEEAGIPLSKTPEPEEIYKIGIGKVEGNKHAARKAFHTMALAAGDALANAVTLIDGLVVIGGGLSGASELFLQTLVNEMNSTFIQPDGEVLNRLVSKIYNLEADTELENFLIPSYKEITIYGLNKRVKYYGEKKLGVGISKLGTSEAISLGAYHYAINQLKR